MTHKREDPRVVHHEADLCVIGGGMAGLCAALAAARHGAKVVLMHDRPVLGGNASSECRMHICGADRSGKIPNMRETGILEELRLENLRRNGEFNYSLWDLILYEKAHFQRNLTLLLNCSCLGAAMDGEEIAEARGWQLTTYTYHHVKARVFMDCSGDGVLAPLTGAEYRMGREGRGEHGESIAPPQADDLTMGMTCLFQAREHATPQPFEAPPWAEKYETADDLPYGARSLNWIEMGYWWIELGGESHSIHDTERVRDELLRITLGVWDFIKNRSKARAAENWALEWIQFLPAKRESHRYVGLHVLTQHDVEAEGRFADIVAYGGWPMDDHHPAGFRAAKLGAPATVFHPAPSPYGIPYRSLISRNVPNLMFAGRCMSCTHAAMSSTRVMGTLAAVGQAAGTAAAMATMAGAPPAAVGENIKELQQTLLRDDCYLPWTPQEFGPLTKSARLEASQGDPAPLRDGVNRPVGEDDHAWACRPGDWVSLRFKGGAAKVGDVALVLDSSLDKNIAMSRHYAGMLRTVPSTLPKAFRVEGLEGGEWRELRRFEGNCQRLVRVHAGRPLEGVRFALESTWGAPETKVFAFYVA